MCPKKFTTTQYWPSINSNLKMANTFFKFDRWALPNEHLFLRTSFLTYITKGQSLYLAITAFPSVSALTLSLLEHVVACLVPRPHYSAWPIRFGSRGPSEPSSDTSPNYINREGLGKPRTGTRKRRGENICQSNVYICGWNPMMSPDNAAWHYLFLRILQKES